MEMLQPPPRLPINVPGEALRIAGAIEATSLADLRRLLDMNTATAFLCSREAIKNLRGRGGRIVNVAAQAGVEPRRGSGMAAYAVSKAAVAALTLALAGPAAATRMGTGSISGAAARC